MTALYRYDITTGLHWAAVSMRDDCISVVFRSNTDGVLAVSISLDEVRSSVVSDHGGMLSFGEHNLRQTNVPKWVDLSATAASAGLTIPKLIAQRLQDSYSVRVLVPSRSIVSLRDCNILLYLSPDATLLADEQAILVSGPLESARLLAQSITSFKTLSTT